jgi:lysozyme family protein
MAARNFEPALSLVLSFEGGYVDHPEDPGGPTNMGITQATLAKERGQAVSKSDVAQLLRSEAARIYRKSYWNAVSGDDLPDGLDLVMFDYAVNSGPQIALKTLSAVLGLAQTASLARPDVMTKLVSIDPLRLIAELCRARRNHLARLKTFPIFGKGWLNRIAQLEQKAIELQRLAHNPLHPRSLALPAAPVSVAPSQPKESSMTNLNDLLPASDAKPFWASQTIWSAIAVIGASTSGAFLAWRANDMAGFGAALTSILGGINAIVGRYRATAPIS